MEILPVMGTFFNNDNMEIRRVRNPEEYPFFMDVYWDEFGTDEDGEEVQRIEGYGFDDEAKFLSMVDDMLRGPWKGQVLKLTIQLNPPITT